VSLHYTFGFKSPVTDARLGDLMLMREALLCYRTTTELTTTFSMAISRVLGLESAEKVVEVIVRGVSY
jgi:hypothetical protein